MSEHIIKLSRGLHTVVDFEDFVLWDKFNWYANPSPSGFYAVRDISRKHFFLHNIICALAHGIGQHSDHINGDTLDNRRSNLRPATSSQNAANRRGPQSNNTSGYLGVYFRSDRKKWKGKVKVGDKHYNTKLCDTPREAAIERDIIALRVQGEFVTLNVLEA